MNHRTSLGSPAAASCALWTGALGWGRGFSNCFEMIKLVVSLHWLVLLNVVPQNEWLQSDLFDTLVLFILLVTPEKHLCRGVFKQLCLFPSFWQLCYLILPLFLKQLGLSSCVTGMFQLPIWPDVSTDLQEAASHLRYRSSSFWSRTFAAGQPTELWCCLWLPLQLVQKFWVNSNKVRWKYHNQIPVLSHVAPGVQSLRQHTWEAQQLAQLAEVLVEMQGLGKCQFGC